MRFYDIMLGPYNATIACLNDRDSAYELRDILKACIRTYMAITGNTKIPSVEVLEDFNTTTIAVRLCANPYKQII